MYEERKQKYSLITLNSTTHYVHKIEQYKSKVQTTKKNKHKK